MKRKGEGRKGGGKWEGNEGVGATLRNIALGMDALALTITYVILIAQL